MIIQHVTKALVEVLRYKTAFLYDTCMTSESLQSKTVFS